MRRLIVTASVIAVVLIAAQAFAIATAEGKNDCLLYGKNCPNEFDGIEERIAKLNIEIAKGEKVYTPNELKKLQRMLNDDNKTMRILNKPGR